MNERIRGTFERTIRKFIDNKWSTKCDTAMWYDGKLRPCMSSKHLTPEGLKYGRLVRLRFRLCSVDF